MRRVVCLVVWRRLWYVKFVLLCWKVDSFGEGEEDEIDGSNAIVSLFNHRFICHIYLNISVLQTNRY